MVSDERTDTYIMKLTALLVVAAVLWYALSIAMQPLRQMSAGAQHAAGIAAEVTR